MVKKKSFKILLLVLFAKSCCSAMVISKEWPVDIGGNVTLPCSNKFEKQLLDAQPVMWIKNGREKEEINRLKILSDGSLLLQKVIKSDTGEYMCRIEKGKSEGDKINGQELNQNDDEIQSRYKLIVRTPPPMLINVSVHPSTVLALLLWEVFDTGGYDISHFSAQYRLKYDAADAWHNILPVNISPNARQIDVYRLNPNSTYTFQIWAVNALGIGEITEIDSTTNHIPEEIELAKHLLDGAENFDTRIWVVAVSVVMGTLFMLSAGVCYFLCRDYNFFEFSDNEQELIELMPNIILNPVFYESSLEGDKYYQMDEYYNNLSEFKSTTNSSFQPVQL